VSEVAGTICERGGQILILKRPDGTWDLPKGLIENESIRSAAVRETEEEIGLTPLLSGKVATGRSPHEGTVWLFYATLPDGEIKLSHEHTDFAWVTPTKAQSILYPPLARIVGSHD
jgi:8-oxo-dGTP pyrophosphatase MutT (NUDIX family)